MGNNKKEIKPPSLKGRGEPPGKSKNLAFFLGVLLLVLFFLFLFRQEPEDASQIAFSDFLTMVDDNYIKWSSVKIIGKQIEASFSLDRAKLNEDNKEDIYLNKYKDYLVQAPKGQPASDVKSYYITSYSPSEIDTLMINKFSERGMKFSSEPQEGNIFTNIILPIIPWLLIFGVLWFFMFRQIQGAGNKAMSFGKSKARLVSPDSKKVTFVDVAGIQEAKEELEETVEFLKSPEKFKKLGAKIPKGVLLVGPPGTGKTLLARSVAGEANRPFFSMSGSEFVEMFVGVGASRVRDLFEQGKKNAPCIIFIDELDAVGRMRGSGYGGGHDEREQTLNQMLVEMDGFDTDQTIIIMAATNRPDVLDPALLRPGRFDRRVIVHLPDVKGREDILKIHMRNVPCSSSVDAQILARGLPGFSGADIANLVNESALIAARRGRKKVQMEDFEYSKDKVLMGVERRSMIISEKERVNTAYHEAGHAILAYLLPSVNQLHKVSIIPRGQALGVTQTLPLEDRYTLTKEYVLEEVMVLFGGRIGEEYKFGPGGITSGASNDIEKGTKLVRTMICEWGMSDLLGPITYGQKEEPIFIGKEIARHKDYSERTAEAIDNEVRKIVDECFNRSKDLIMSNIEKLEKLAKALLEHESLDITEIDVLLGNGTKSLDSKGEVSNNGDSASVTEKGVEGGVEKEKLGKSDDKLAEDKEAIDEELARKVKIEKQLDKQELDNIEDKQAEV